MSNKEKNISLINQKIEASDAVIFTEREFKKKLQDQENLKVSDVDVITVGFQSSLSASAIMILVPVAGRGDFTRAKKMWLNGVLGFPGPAPNERLGVADTLIFADQISKNKGSDYNGANLLVDIINNKKIEVECLSIEGDTYHNAFTLDQIQFARLYTYNSFYPSINVFSECESCGINKSLEMIRIGSVILLNKAPGVIVGCGTRSTPERKTLSLAADIYEMDTGIITKFESKTGMPMANSIAIPIPVINEDVLNCFSRYLKQANFPETGADNSSPDQEVAVYLKELILNKKYLLTDSDMELKY